MPSPQNALDLFKGEWWSSFPESCGALQAGLLPTFSDTRITWAVEAMGGVRDQAVLELGPLEGGHTYFLERAGAKSIVAVEANMRAYMKCLIAKEVVGLQRARFLLGDFEVYLREVTARFDTAIACGVLYHVRQPVELLHNLARVTDRIFLWTHYYDRDLISRIPHMAHRMRGNHAATHAGFPHTLHRYEYGDFLDTTRFAGGTEEFSHWLSREDLLAALRHVGFANILLGEDDLHHVNGPCLSLVASRG